MKSADVKADVKQQEIKEMVAISLVFVRRPPIQKIKTGVYFALNFGYFIHLHIFG